MNVTTIKQRCQRCILPDTFPGVSFNEKGICNFCQRSPSKEQVTIVRQALQQEMAQIIKQHKGSGMYDCIVAFSGGKDSSYTLKLLVEEYHLNCLAVTIDNGFISEQAYKNCKTITQSLGIDHIFYTPATSFMNKMYRKSAEAEGVHTRSAIKRASCMCNSCINLINNYMIKLSLQNGVGLIAGGYIGGQVPKDAAVMVVNLSAQAKHRTVANERYVKHFGKEANRYYGLPATLLQEQQSVTIINPMLTVAINEEEIIDCITPLGWKKTKDTGKNSSNCRLNDLGIAVHHKQYGFNPYVFELALQVREGVMDRVAALAKVETIPTEQEVAQQAKTIGLNLDTIDSRFKK